MTKPKYPTAGTKVTPEMLPYCVTLRQVAEVLNVSYRTVQGYVEEGRFPIVDLGHRTKRVYYEDLEVYVQNRREIDEAMVKFYKRDITRDTMLDRFRTIPPDIR